MISGLRKKGVTQNQIDTVNEFFNKDGKYKFNKTMVKIMLELKNSCID